MRKAFLCYADQITQKVNRKYPAKEYEMGK